MRKLNYIITFGILTTIAFITFSQQELVFAQSNNTENIKKSYNNFNNEMMLGDPFYVEHYSNISVELQDANKSFNYTLYGNGIVDGKLNVTTEDNSTVTYRNNNTVLVQGHTISETVKGDTAAHIFLELGNINPDDLTYSGSGIGIFNENATGELEFLSNVVAIYKSHIDTNGNGTYWFWHWSK